MHAFWAMISLTESVWIQVKVHTVQTQVSSSGVTSLVLLSLGSTTSSADIENPHFAEHFSEDMIDKNKKEQNECKCSWNVSKYVLGVAICFKKIKFCNRIEGNVEIGHHLQYFYWPFLVNTLTVSKETFCQEETNHDHSSGKVVHSRVIGSIHHGDENIQTNTNEEQ